MYVTLRIFPAIRHEDGVNLRHTTLRKIYVDPFYFLEDLCWF
jgi:hypothetical protein